MLKHYPESLINFSSNDYLGLSKHPLLISRATEYAQKYGVGSISSRLVTGNLPLFEELESQLAKSLGKPEALILGTGYQTNCSVLEALLDERILGHEPTIFCDRLCHASMLPKKRLHRFRHNDLNHLETLLKKNQSAPSKFILAESIYSMEGDEADLRGLTSLAKQYQAFLYVDDAHAIGVYGWGKCVEFANEIDVIMGTFSKAMGSMGAYIACSKVVYDYLINKCKGLIYSTALSPAILGAISASFEVMPTLEKKAKEVLNAAANLRFFLKENGLNYGASTTHIIPWIIGDSNRTLFLSHQLERSGILGATIRHPSVPVGKSRIRFCISTMHSKNDIEKLKSALSNLLELDKPQTKP